jgi:hypothetical protein
MFIYQIIGPEHRRTNNEGKHTPQRSTPETNNQKVMKVISKQNSIHSVEPVEWRSSSSSCLLLLLAADHWFDSPQRQLL